MRSWKLATAIVTSFMLIGIAAAQQPPGGFGGGGGFGRGGFGGLSATLAFNRQLQEELKMDKEQVEKLTEAMTKVREDLGDIFAKMREASMEERVELFKKISET